MNILLVDDDSYVLEALKKSLNWEQIGIENVYTAQSVKKAKKIIGDVLIHILICDIEMPKENGFELLKWIKEKKYIIKDILLTSYAEFKYASEAIKYNCYAYALKPIDYKELEQLLIGAIEEEKKALNIINHEKYMEYWTASEKMRKEQFLLKLIQNPSQHKEWMEEADYKKNELFLPIIVTYSFNGEEENTFERGMLEWDLKNLITEGYSEDRLHGEAVLDVKNDSYLAVIKIEDKDVLPEVLTVARSILNKANKRLHIFGSVMIGVMTDLKGLIPDSKRLIEYAQKTIIEPDSILLLNDYNLAKPSYTVPDFTLWESFLKDKQVEVLKAEINQYLEKQRSFYSPNKEILRDFIMNFIQLLISLLKAKGIMVYPMGKSLFDSKWIDFSVQSITNAKKGTHKMIDRVMDILKEEEEEKSIVITVKSYIDHNLDQDISRESLAEQVYLNQDYLARIFKKEIGESIGTYITRKRVERAKEYLIKTNESVNAIALNVGYDNFSYFSKVFKSCVGVTPKEFRKQERKGI